MAAASDKDTEADKPAAKGAAAKDEQGDVLVYLDRVGSIRAVWNVVKRAGFGGVQVGSHTIPPGLSIVPAASWPLVKDSATWKQHSTEEAEGKIPVRAVAGVGRPLIEGWHKVKDKDAIAWIGKTGLIETLERLHTMESTRNPSRPAVAAAIDAQLRKVRELVAGTTQGTR